MAAAADPERKRFQRDGLAQLLADIDAPPTKFKLDFLGPEELVTRGLEIEETYDNPAYADQAKTILASEGGRSRDGAAAIDRLIDAHYVGVDPGHISNEKIRATQSRNADLKVISFKIYVWFI